MTRNAIYCREGVSTTIDQVFCWEHSAIWNAPTLPKCWSAVEYIERVYTNLLWMNANIKRYILVSLHGVLLRVALITALRYIISNPRLKQKLYV